MFRFAVIASLTAFLALVSQFARADEGFREGTVVFANGVEWQVGNLEMSRFDGLHRLQVDAYPLHLRAGFKFDEEMIVALCNAVLTYLPQTLDPVVSAGAIYRLDMRFGVPSPQPSDIDWEAERFVHLTVADAKCQGQKRNGNFSPTFGPSTGQWFISRSRMRLNGGPVRIEFWKPVGTPMTMDRFAFQIACQAIVADPTLGFNLPAHVGSLYRLIEERGLEIVASGGLRTTLFEVGPDRSKEFRVVNGVCVERAKGMDG